MNEFLGFVAKRVKSAVDTAIIGDNVGLNPRAINKLIQILHALHSMSEARVSVVCMTSYRFPPAKMTGPFFAVLGVTLLVLGTPAVLSLALPEHEPETEPVVLDDPEWHQPIDGVECSVSYESMANQAWYCGDTLVEAYLNADVDDDELALRRAVRATTFGSMPKEEVENQNGILVLRTSTYIPVVAFSVAKDDLNYELVFSDGNPEELADQFMEAFK
ncbi:hypothetical protein GCM10009604_20810 [Corynebacterium aurimucosum]